jgi:hypothetical protein
MSSKDRIRRPVRFSDFIVIFAGFIYNITQTVEAFASEVYELSIYHANQKTDELRVWEEFTNDLEKIQEDTDGA